MSQFSIALAAAAEQVGMNQTDLSKATGISLSSMSKYFRDSAPVGRQVAAKLIAAFPPPHNSQLLAAYLRDEIPAGCDDLVAILANGQLHEAKPDPIPSRDKLDGPARELVAYFAQRVDDPVIYNMLAATRKALEA